MADAARLLEEAYPLLPMAFLADIIMFHVYLFVERRRSRPATRRP